MNHNRNELRIVTGKTFLCSVNAYVKNFRDCTLAHGAATSASAPDEESGIVFGMPKEAIAANAACYVLPLPKIAPALEKLFDQQTENTAP